MTATIDLTQISIDELDKINDFQELTEWTKGCTACTLRPAATQPVHYSGDPNSPVMVLGINPGLCEEGSLYPFTGRAELQESRCVTCVNYSKCYQWQTGIGTATSPRVSRCIGYTKDPSGVVHQVPTQVTAGKFIVGGLRSAGQVLDDLLVALNIDRKKLFLTNAALCRSEGNAEPKPQEFNRCSSIRLATQRLIQPKIIIPLGNAATTQYTGKKSTMSHIHGIPIKYQDGNFLTATVVPSYHPSAIFRLMLGSTHQNLNEFETTKTQVRDLKWNMFQDLTTAFNLLDETELANLVLDSSKLVNGKLPVRTQ